MNIDIFLNMKTSKKKSELPREKLNVQCSKIIMGEYKKDPISCTVSIYELEFKSFLAWGGMCSSLLTVFHFSICLVCVSDLLATISLNTVFCCFFLLQLSVSYLLMPLEIFWWYTILIWTLVYPFSLMSVSLAKLVSLSIFQHCWH